MLYHFSDTHVTKEKNFFHQMHQIRSDGDDDNRDQLKMWLVQYPYIWVLPKSNIDLISRGEPNEEVVGREQIQGQQVSWLVPQQRYNTKTNTNNINTDTNADIYNTHKNTNTNKNTNTSGGTTSMLISGGTRTLAQNIVWQLH